jgi:glycosyltransferase involved in cell wall biosynthesis
MIQSDKVPLISVVILCYNHADFISECLDSVVQQTFDGSMEVIVGDDASTDSSRAIVESYVDRFPGVVKLLAHESNVGFSRNYADVIHAASGKYIAYLDGDDLMLPGKLSRQVEFLETHPDFGLIAHKMRHVDAYSKLPVDYPQPRFRPEVFGVTDVVLHPSFFGASSMMFRAEERRKIEIDLTLTAVGDVLNSFHILYGTKGYRLNEELGIYRVNPKGITSTIIRVPRRRAEADKDVLYSFDRAAEIGVDVAIVEEGRARYLLTSAIFYLQNDSYGEFVDSIEASMRASKIGATQFILYATRHFPRMAKQICAKAKAVRNAVSPSPH